MVNLAERVAVNAVPVTRRFLSTVRCVCACMLSAVFLLMVFGAAAAETKRVLMLHSFGRDIKPWSEYARNIRAELDQQSPWPLELSEHSLMLTSNQGSEAPFVEYPEMTQYKRRRNPQHNPQHQPQP